MQFSVYKQNCRHKCFPVRFMFLLNYFVSNLFTFFVFHNKIERIDRLLRRNWTDRPSTSVRPPRTYLERIRALRTIGISIPTTSTVRKVPWTTVHRRRLFITDPGAVLFIQTASLHKKYRPFMLNSFEIPRNIGTNRLLHEKKVSWICVFR